MERIKINLDLRNGQLLVKPSGAEVGAQFDNHAVILEFTRPPELSDDDLYLLFDNGARTFDAVRLGESSSFSVPCTLTQTHRLNMQVVFKRDGRTVVHSDIAELRLRPSLRGKLSVSPEQSGEWIPEAPADGKTYGRRDGDWEEITGGAAKPAKALPIATEANPDWKNWNGIFSFGFPDLTIPRIYNMLGGGPLYNDGMIVSQCGDNSRWNQRNFPNGGHVFEGWSKDRKYRFTCLVLERDSVDNLPRAAVQVFDFGAQKFGWLKVGSDSKDDAMGGWEFTDTWAKAHTPVTFRPQTAPVSMPENNPVHNGSMYFGEDGYLHVYSGGRWRRLAFAEEAITEPVTVTEYYDTAKSLSNTAPYGQPITSQYSWGYTDYIPAKIGDSVTVSTFMANTADRGTVFCYDDSNNCVGVFTPNTTNDVLISLGLGLETRYYFDYTITIPNNPKLASMTKIRVISHKYPDLDIEAHPFYVTVNYRTI